MPKGIVPVTDADGKQVHDASGRPRTRNLAPKDYRDYVKALGAEAKGRALKELDAPECWEMPPNKRRKLLKKRIGQGREAARKARP